MCGAELHALPEGVQRVARALQDANHPHTPLMLDGAARTTVSYTHLTLPTNREV